MGKKVWPCGLLAALIACSVPAAAQVLAATLLRASELRGDKLAQAPVLARLGAGDSLRVLSVEGGWALAETREGSRGWLRAGALDLRAQTAAAARIANGRQAPTAQGGVMTLGVRSLPARSNRHALIIGVSRYADSAIPPLPGARVDRESATQMAAAMQVPPENIRYLQDEQATGEGIRAAVRELDQRVREGDRVFLHFSGHGTRFKDPQTGGCTEALLAHDGGWPGTITNREMAKLLEPVTRKADKLFAMFDACYSGGVIGADPQARTRGLSIPGDEGRLRPKFSSTSDECSQPVNVKSRNLVVEASASGTLPQDIIHISSSREDEVSFDDELKGGLATQFMRDCLLRDAKDADASGAISVEEVRACAQEKLDKRLRDDQRFRPPHLVLSGNQEFVPAWFGAEQLVALPVLAPPAPVVPPAPAMQPAPLPASLTGAQALRQIFEQRDAKRKVDVALSQSPLRIGKDALSFSVQSAREGYLYVAIAGSDNESIYVLFPNTLDANNRVGAGQKLQLPRPGWRVRAAGPAGTDHLLVLVADSPRDLDTLAAASSVGPFLKSLNDTTGRAALGALLTRAPDATAASCRRRNLAQSACSDAFGAALVDVEEIP